MSDNATEKLLTAEEASNVRKGSRVRVQKHGTGNTFEGIVTLVWIGAFGEEVIKVRTSDLGDQSAYPWLDDQVTLLAEPVAV